MHLRSSPSKAVRRPITQQRSPPRRPTVSSALHVRPVSVLSQTPSFQILNNSATDERPDAPEKPRRSIEEPNGEVLSASPLLGKHRQKYEIENHSYLGIKGAAVVGGVLQRDEAALLKEKKLKQQQEVKAALQMQMMEKEQRVKAERSTRPVPIPAESTQSEETEPNLSAAGIQDLYQEILKEHQSLKAQVESQELWIRQLVSQQAQPSPQRSILKSKAKRTQIASASQRRVQSSAAGLNPYAQKDKGLGLFLENYTMEDVKGAINSYIPVTSTPTPAHSRTHETNLDTDGDSQFIYPSEKGEFEHWEGKQTYGTEDRRKRQTSVPRQRKEDKRSLRFPKEVFPMHFRRRPAFI